MYKKVFLAVLLTLFVVSSGYAGEEKIISEGKISADNFTSIGDAMFDRAHMCSQSVSDFDCAIPESYTLLPDQPKFHLRFWAPASQSYNRHYLITDSAGTLVSYDFFSGFLPFSWNERVYVPSSFFGICDYTFYVVYQGNDGRAAVKSSFFAVR